MVVQTAVWQHKNFTPYSEEYIDEVSKRQNRWWWDEDILGWNIFWDPSKLKRWDITDTNDYVYDWQNWLRIWTPAATAVVNQINSSWMYWNPNNNRTSEERNPETPKKKINKRWSDPTKTVPTYVAPDGSVHEGMTQDQFNQRMQEYQMENDAYKRQQDNQLQDLYTRALDKYMKEPDSFTEAQKQALVNTAEKLWHLDSLLPSIVSWENMSNITSPTPTVTATQASSLPTVNQVTNQDNNASNYWGRYAWSNAWSEETRRSQWASNAAGFSL